MDMNVFRKDNWNKASTDKKQALQNLENHYATQQGRNPIILQFVDSNNAGGFNVVSNTIEINQNMLVNNDSFQRYQVIDTVIHEGRHAYQNYAINHPGTHPNQEEEDKWREDDLGYIGADSPDLYKYRFQAQERDAYDYAAGEMGRMFKSMPGEEHIYRQYEQIVDNFNQKFSIEAEARLGKDYIQKIDEEVAERAKKMLVANNLAKQAARIASTAPPSSLDEPNDAYAVSYDMIKIKSPWEIQSIHDLRINKTLNHHAELHISALISEQAGKKAGLQETVDDSIQIHIEDGEEKRWLFKGRLKEVSIIIDGGLYILTASFLSETSILDRKEKSRSFQDTNRTYDDIVALVLQDYPGKSFELTAAEIPINGPIIQYQETDWKFIKRLASLQETVIVPDVILDEQIFSFGYPTGSAKTLPEDIAYATGKNIKAFYEAWSVNPAIIENEFAYFEVESYEELTMGDEVTFHNYQMVVGAVTIELKNGLLVYHARLVRNMTVRQNPIYNTKIQGVSLAGTVIDLQDQSVRLHLAIDQEQNQEEAYWYPFSPPTTDMMYLMPQMGTIANLYIPGLMEQNAIITGSARNNGGSCEKTGDPNTRYLGTEYGQELKLAPGGIYLTAGRNDLIVNFDDNKGVTLSSHKGMILEAKEEIIIDSKQTVSFNAASQILMTTPSGGLSMENEMHFRVPKVFIDCTDNEEYSPVEQPEPEKEEANQEKEESAINWLGIAGKALATVAVVAVAAVASYAAIQVLGPAGVPIVGAILGVAQTAIGDIWNEELSDPMTYFNNAVKGAVIAFATEALFGPYIAAAMGAKLWGQLFVLGGASGGFASALEDILSNRNIDFGKAALTALAAGILTPVATFLAPKISAALRSGGASKAGVSDTVKYYRVQGGTGSTTKVSQSRIQVNEDGSIIIPNKDANLNVSAYDLEHAQYFRDTNRPGGQIVEMEVPKWYDDFVKENLVPQEGYKTNIQNQGGTAPKIVDPSTPGTSYELPSPWVGWLEENVSNAKIIK